MKNILLVEDDPFLSDVQATSFKQEDFKVDVANDGQMAFEKIKRSMPDLVLLDIDLPKMNGCELLEAIHRDPSMKNIKVMVLSNYTPEAITQKYHVDIFNLGAIRHYLKVETPVAEIVEAAKEILNKK
jgi:CheY-like chemotaxis protein